MVNRTTSWTLAKSTPEDIFNHAARASMDAFDKYYISPPMVKTFAITGDILFNERIKDRSKRTVEFIDYLKMNNIGRIYLVDGLEYYGINWRRIITESHLSKHDTSVDYCAAYECISAFCTAISVYDINSYFIQ